MISLFVAGGTGALTMLLLIVTAVACRRYQDLRKALPINEVAGMILPCPDDSRWTRDSRSRGGVPVFVLGTIRAPQGRKLLIDDIEIPDSKEYVDAVERAYTARLAEQALVSV